MVAISITDKSSLSELPQYTRTISGTGWGAYSTSKELARVPFLMLKFRKRVLIIMAEETQVQIVAQIVAQTADATAKAVASAAQAAAEVMAKENYTSLTAIAVLQTEMTILKNQQSSFETEITKKVDALTPKFEKIFEKLDEVSQGRPSWIVSIAITTLFGICSGLIVFVFTKLVN